MKRVNRQKATARVKAVHHQVANLQEVVHQAVVHILIIIVHRGAIRILAEVLLIVMIHIQTAILLIQKQVHQVNHQAEDIQVLTLEVNDKIWRRYNANKYKNCRYNNS